MKSLHLHPFARRIVASCHQLNAQRLAPGNHCCLTALDETEQLLWTTSEAIPFAQLTAENLTVRAFENSPEDSSLITRWSIQPKEQLSHQCWQRDVELLRAQPSAQAVLQSYAPHVVAWGRLIQAKRISADNLPDDFSALFLPTLNEDGLLSAVKSHANVAKPVNLIFGMNEAPILLATSPEDAVSQLLWLEAFAQTQLLMLNF